MNKLSDGMRRLADGAKTGAALAGVVGVVATTPDLAVGAAMAARADNTTIELIEDAQPQVREMVEQHSEAYKMREEAEDERRAQPELLGDEPPEPPEPDDPLEVDELGESPGPRNDTAADGAADEHTTEGDDDPEAEVDVLSTEMDTAATDGSPAAASAPREAVEQVELAVDIDDEETMGATEDDQARLVDSADLAESSEEIDTSDVEILAEIGGGDDDAHAVDSGVGDREVIESEDVVDNPLNGEPREFADEPVDEDDDLSAVDPEFADDADDGVEPMDLSGGDGGSSATNAGGLRTDVEHERITESGAGLEQESTEEAGTDDLGGIEPMDMSEDTGDTASDGAAIGELSDTADATEIGADLGDSDMDFGDSDSDSDSDGDTGDSGAW